MVRGLQKSQSQAKAQQKLASQGQPKSQFDARLKALKITCPSCKIGISTYTSFKNHWESRHDKLPLPSEESLAASASK